MKVDLLRVKAERVAKGYTQAQMAERMGLARDQYNKRENGKISFSADELITLADLLGYSKDEIGIFLNKAFPKSNNNIKGKATAKLLVNRKLNKNNAAVIDTLTAPVS